MDAPPGLGLHMCFTSCRAYTWVFCLGWGVELGWGRVGLGLGWGEGGWGSEVGCQPCEVGWAGVRGGVGGVGVEGVRLGVAGC